MKAAVFTRYGPPDVLQIEDVVQPIPKASELLVRVRATTVCAGDVRLRKADPFFLRMISGLWRPKSINVPGMEFAGTVESRGANVTTFGAGDEVFGSMGLKFGAYAEYVCVPEGPMVARKPANATFEEAAALPYGGVSALHFLRQARLKAGDKVLIYGASGSVGTFAVQLAKHYGAHVTGVCGSANSELVRSLGADEVVDYTTEDFSRRGRIYDIVLDTVGKGGVWRSLRSLKRGGSYILTSSGLLSFGFAWLWCSITRAATLVGGMARAKPDDLCFLAALVEAGSLKAVIDRRYRLSDIAEAHRFVETGRKRGNVAIVIAENGEA